MRISPLLGSSSFRSSLMHVDLPQPVGPTRKTNSPRPMRSEKRSIATEPPSYTFVTSSSSTTGMSGSRRRRLRTRSASRDVPAVGMRTVSSTGRSAKLRKLQGLLQRRRARSQALERVSAGNTPAREEVAFALRHRDELELPGLDQVPPGDDRQRRRAAAQLGAQRQEQLVDEPGGEQERVERGAALAEDRAHTVVGAQRCHEPS